MNTLSNPSLLVASCSLKELFNRCEPIKSSCNNIIEGHLHIPEYQRPYRWDDQQVFELHQDIKENLKIDKHYYLGSIILHQSTSGDGKNLLNIIDGQQRITSMAILSQLAGYDTQPTITFSAPQSIQRIKANLNSLKEKLEKDDYSFESILDKINVTLVVTNSEDDAYKFFETQNTGGIRLSGVDIIKAHHLRAIDANKQDAYAKKWEEMPNLALTVDGVMRARFWKTLGWRNLETNWLSNESRQGIKRELVEKELADCTFADERDVGFRSIQELNHLPDKHLAILGATYAMRQPLSAGVNSIHYLEQFHSLYQKWCKKDKPENASTYHHYYHQLISKAESSYLKQLYDTTLLLYLSKFGEEKILEASLWLFRYVFSLRMGLVVREKSVQKFAKDGQLLDWIESSYNHEQLIHFLQNFTYKFEAFKLQEGGVRQRFLMGIKGEDALHIKLDENVEEKSFDTALQKAIKNVVIEKDSQITNKINLEIAK